MASNLDFEELLSREFRPAEVVCLAPREKFHPRDPSEANKKKRRSALSTTSTTAIVGKEDDDKSEEEERSRQRDFVVRLVAQTPSFRRHLSPEEQEKVLRDRDQLTVKPPVTQNNPYTRLDPKFLPLALTDWESKINWEGVPENFSNETQQDKKEDSPTDAQLVKRARAYLSRPINPCLEGLVLDETTICWDGMDDPEKWASKSSPPLVLQLGVAGRSCADKIYLGLSAQRPAPANQEAAYQARQERESNSTAVVSAADATKNKGSLHQDKQKLEAFIAARQEKRAQMAKEKTSRIAKAMDSLHLGGGRSRTITSSLMGPGGTERTGRPSRSMTGAYLEEAYQEQLDLIQNHSLVRDLSKVMLRQYHRPKLPYSVVRPDLSWQFQIRYAPIKKESTSAQVTSFISPHSGALAKAKFRSESDLSPSEGKLVLLEYCEERPPIQLVKGMRSKVCLEMYLFVIRLLVVSSNFSHVSKRLSITIEVIRRIAPFRRVVGTNLRERKEPMSRHPRPLSLPNQTVCHGFKDQIEKRQFLIGSASYQKSQKRNVLRKMPLMSCRRVSQRFSIQKSTVLLLGRLTKDRRSVLLLATCLSHRFFVMNQNPRISL